LKLRVCHAATILVAASVLGCIEATDAEQPLPNAAGAVDLPEPRRDGDVPVERALAMRRSVRQYADTPLSLAALAQLAWSAQGITDSAGHRTSPSAGALYPLELYVVAGDVPGLEAGIYRYVPAGHRLVRHADGDARDAVARAALQQSWLADAPAILVLAGVTERTAGKYGSRAPRFVHIEVGHAAQNVYLQAEALGLGTCIVGGFDDRQLKRVLALPEAEAPLALLPVGAPR
jgi:SagB-type dehydrogenase family enzyme